jgi:hypothetical protein
LPFGGSSDAAYTVVAIAEIQGQQGEGVETTLRRGPGADGSLFSTLRFKPYSPPVQAAPPTDPKAESGQTHPETTHDSLTKLMLKLDGPLEMQIKQFWDWWTGELLSMVPENIRKILGAGTEYLILTLDDHGVGVVHYKDGVENPLVHFLPNETGDEPKSRFLNDNPQLQDLKIALRLTPTQGLRKQIKLPMAAVENLGQVVSFEMDRLTPFKSDQVYFSTFIVNRFKATRQILVELILTRAGQTRCDTLTSGGLGLAAGNHLFDWRRQTWRL